MLAWLCGCIQMRMVLVELIGEFHFFLEEIIHTVYIQWLSWDHLGVLSCRKKAKMFHVMGMVPFIVMDYKKNHWASCAFTLLRWFPNVNCPELMLRWLASMPCDCGISCLIVYNFICPNFIFPAICRTSELWSHQNDKSYNVK